MSRPLQGRPLALTPTQQRELAAWAAYGRSTSDVARRLGVAPRTVQRYLKRENKGLVHG